MITAYIGLPGMGKTLGMVYKTCEALKSGKTVYSNVDITDNVFNSKISTIPYTKLMSVMENATDALICIDEASIVLPNYFWNNLSIDLLMKFAQVRKYGLDIMYTSQGWSHTVKRLRDLTNYVVECRTTRLAHIWETINPEYYHRNVPIAFRKDYVLQKESKLRIFGMSNKLYSSFDTLQRVDVSSLSDTKKVERIKKGLRI